jgi:hypothetical protein
MNTPTEPGLYWARKKGLPWSTVVRLQETALQQTTTGCSVVVLPNEHFEVRDYVTNYVADGWEFRPADKPPA